MLILAAFGTLQSQPVFPDFAVLSSFAQVFGAAKNTDAAQEQVALFAGESCSTAADCGAKLVCVNGACGSCSASNAGELCSDDAVNPYTADGVCTYDKICQESTVCEHPVLAKPFAGCNACGDGASCGTNSSGGVSYNGVCLDKRCYTEYCSSGNESKPEACGAIEIACSALNEGKSCDGVSDSTFNPNGKICSNGQCAVSQPPSDQNVSPGTGVTGSGTIKVVTGNGKTIDVNVTEFDTKTIDEIERPGEQPCDRKDNANIYCDGDNRTAYIYGAPVNYADENGSIKKIDRGIKALDKAGKLAKANAENDVKLKQKLQARADYDYEAEQGAFNAYWKNSLSQPDAVRVDKGDFTLSFSVSGLLYDDGNGNVQDIGKIATKPGSNSVFRNRSKFADVFSGGIDLEYAYSFDGLQKTLTINSRGSLPAPNSGSGSLMLKFKEELGIPDNLTLYVNGSPYDGSTITTSQHLELRDASGTAQLFIPVARAISSDRANELAPGNPSGNNFEISLTYTIEKQGGKVFLYTNIPYSWLDNGSRVYPVRIDPTTNITISAGANDGDVYLETGVGTCRNLNSSFFRGNSFVTVNTIYRSWLNFSTAGITAGSPIASVSLKLYNATVTGTDYTDEVRDLNNAINNCADDPTILYNAIGPGAQIYTTTSCFTALPTGAYKTCDLGSTAATNLFNQLSSGAYFNVGIRKSTEPVNGANWAEADAYEAGASLWPVLVVVYVSNAPGTVTATTSTSYPLNSTRGAVTLGWTDANEETGYDVQRSNDSGTNWGTLSSVAANTITYTGSDIADNSTYWYRVATKGSGGSVNSGEKVVLIYDRSGPSVPTSFTASVGNASSSLAHADLNWLASDDNSSYTTFIAPNMLGYWRFEEGSGTIAYDSSEQDKNGTLVSSPAYVNGKIGKALSFNGSSNYVQTTYVLPTTNFSYTFWAKSSASGIGNRPFGAADGSAGLYGADIIWGYPSASQLYMVARRGANVGTYDITATAPGIASGWHMVTATVSSTAGSKLYWDDGSLIGSNALTTDITTGSLSLNIGKESNSAYYFNGQIDEVAVFNRVLSATDVNTLYHIGARKYGLEKSADNGGSWNPMNGTFQPFTAANGTDITSISGWTKGVADGSTYTIAENKLRMYHPAAAPDGTQDYALFTLTNEIKGNAIVEFDVNIADSTGWDFMFVAGSSASTISSDFNTSLWSRINNENYQIYNGSAYVTAKALTIGQTYHMKIIFDQYNKKTTVYINDVNVGGTVYTDSGTTGLKKLWFANAGYSTVDTTWYVDNLKITPLLDANTFADTNAIDSTAPSTPPNPGVISPATTTLNVAWNASTDSGNDYNYTVTAFDSFGNESNLVKSFGFEDDFLIDWANAVATTTGTSQASDDAYLGTYSLKLNGNGGTVAFGRSQSFGNTLAGKTVLLSGWMKTALTAGQVNIDLFQSGTIDTGGIVVSGTTPWTYYSEVVKVPSNATSLELRAFGAGSPNGSAWIDNVKVQEISSATVSSGLKQYFVNCVIGTLCTAGGTDAKDKVVAGATTTSFSSLDLNGYYCFTVLATDNADNNSSATSSICKFTLANVPSAPTVATGTPADTTLNVTVNVNGNPAATQFAIYDMNTALYVQANGTEGASAIWQTVAI
ncbi:MAG: LamG-like jellyroll fold domain-containing protein, partial [archaeon]